MSSSSAVLGQQDAGPKPSPLGVFNIFIDPVATARSVPAPLAWLAPLAIFCIVLVVYSWMLMPITTRVTLANAAANGASGEQLERMRSAMETFGKVGVFIAPVFVVGFMALGALIVMLLCSAMSMKASFRDLFTLMSAASLIGVLQIIASYIVIHAKADEIQTMQQLKPPLGLDLFAGDMKGPLFAILNFFSIFEIWSIVMMGLTLAIMTRSSKGKAFAAITPAWIIPLLLAMVGSLFQK